MSPISPHSLHRLKEPLFLWGFVCASLISFQSAAAATELIVKVSEVRSADGVVTIALCPEDKFLGDECPYEASSPAVEGDTYVLFPEVEPGVYGVQGFHDANGNGEMDLNFVGWPLEGFCFANDPQVILKAPSFDEASVTVGADNLEVTMSMRYRTPGS